MGGAYSTLTTVQPNNGDLVDTKIREYHRLSKEHLPEGQTKTFNQYVTTDEVDFTDQFNMAGLDKFFLKARTGEGFNCLGLFRQSQEGGVDMPLLSNENYTVLHPLGLPGRDIGATGAENTGGRVSHLMCIKNTTPGDEVPYTFNDCLYTDEVEDADFKARVEFLEQAVLNLKNNIQIKDCGPLVIARATELGLATSTTMQEYFAKAICGLSDEVRTGKDSDGNRKGPGYQLIDASGNDVSQDLASVKSLIIEIYSTDDLKTFTAIQPPSHNTQITSHIHTFQVKEMPECMSQNYYDVHTIMKTKEDMKTQRQPEPEPEPEQDDDDCVLRRQSTDIRARPMERMFGAVSSTNRG